MPLFIGIDVGTQGVRILCCNESGRFVAGASRNFSSSVTVAPDNPGWFEQVPQIWWALTVDAIRETLKQLNSPQDIAAISVDSTSGTVVALGYDNEPLRPALMYNDSRASLEAQECNRIGNELCNRLGFRFASSFALPKIMWLLRNEPKTVEKTRFFIHAADYIAGKLTGDFGISDYSNALKTGYDLELRKWPEFFSSDLHLDMSKLPEIVRPGDIIGHTNTLCSESTGIPAGCPVAAGATDGTAGFLASGASKPGEWSSTLGTTLVVRGVSEKLIVDPLGRFYCHLSPDGHWLPGGAGNVGCECLVKIFPGCDYHQLDSAALNSCPVPLNVYPLVKKGERLPFVDPNAQGFVDSDLSDTAQLYSAYLQGVAFVERWCYETAETIGAPIGDTVFTTGGGAKSAEWMQIRADVLNKVLIRPECTESAMGAAILAASRTFYTSASEAAAHMVTIDHRVEPRAGMIGKFENAYKSFRKACQIRRLGNEA